MTGPCDCGVGVAVGGTGVLVAVGVTGVLVGVGVLVLPGGGVLVAVGVFVCVGVGVLVLPGGGVLVLVAVGAMVGVLVGVAVGPPGVRVGSGVFVAVPGTGVLVGAVAPPVALSAASCGKTACGVSVLRSKGCCAPAFSSLATLNAAMTSRIPIPRGIPIRRLKWFTSAPPRS